MVLCHWIKGFVILNNISLSIMNFSYYRDRCYSQQYGLDLCFLLYCLIIGPWLTEKKLTTELDIGFLVLGIAYK